MFNCADVAKTNVCHIVNWASMKGSVLKNTSKVEMKQ